MFVMQQHMKKSTAQVTEEKVIFISFVDFYTEVLVSHIVLVIILTYFEHICVNLYLTNYHVIMKLVLKY